MYEGHILELQIKTWIWKWSSQLWLHYLSSSEKKAWKKFRPVWDLNLWPLRYWCSALPTEPTSLSHSLIFFFSVPDAILQSKFSKSCQVLVKIMASHAADGTPGLLRPVSKVFSVTFQCKIYLCRTNSGSKHHLHYISLLQIGLKQCPHNLIIFINIMMYRVFVTCTLWRR